MNVLNVFQKKSKLCIFRQIIEYHTSYFKKTEEQHVYIQIKKHHLFRECFIRAKHWMSLGILVQHLTVGPVVLNLEKKKYYQNQVMI